MPLALNDPLKPSSVPAATGASQRGGEWRKRGRGDEGQRRGLTRKKRGEGGVALPQDKWPTKLDLCAPWGRACMTSVRDYCASSAKRTGSSRTHATRQCRDCVGEGKVRLGDATGKKVLRVVRDVLAKAKLKSEMRGCFTLERRVLRQRARFRNETAVLACRPTAGLWIALRTRSGGNQNHRFTSRFPSP